MKTVDGIIIVIVAIALIVLVAIYPANAAVDSTSSLSADGFVTSRSSMTDSQCGSVSSQSSNVFGNADVEYDHSTNGTQSTSSLTSNTGTVGYKGSTFTMTWELPKQICGGDTCNSVGGYYTQVAAGLTAYMRGSGNITTVAGLNSYNVNAVGNGSLTHNINVIDMKGNTNDESDTNVCDMISNSKYSEKTVVVGKYNLTSRFVFTR